MKRKVILYDHMERVIAMSELPTDKSFLRWENVPEGVRCIEIYAEQQLDIVAVSEKMKNVSTIELVDELRRRVIDWPIEET